MKFLLDNNVSPKLARALHELCADSGHQVYALRDRFAPATPDAEWLAELADQGEWIVVTQDRRIARNPDERETWRRGGLPTFFLTSGWASLEFWPKAEKLVHAWPALLRQALDARMGVAFLLHVGGRLERFSHS